jgi:hypothetical protein
MLLICDICETVTDQLAKIPCGFYIEKEGDQRFFVQPLDELAYRNLCLDCLTKM